MREFVSLLVVEDDREHRELIARAFEDDDEINVFWADSILQARETILTVSLDIILSDWRLKDGNGIDLLKEEKVAVPLVLMTSFGNEELAVSALKSGAMDYVVKSSQNFSLLPATIRRIIRECDQKNALQNAEKALVESEERYRLAVEGSNDIIWDWKPSDNKVYFSERWYEMLGFKCCTDHMLFSDWEEMVYSEDRKEFVSRMEDHLSGLTPYYTCEFRVKNVQGEIRWMFSRGKALIGSDGKVKRVSGSITDITSRKNYEQRIEELAFYDQITGLPNRTMFIEHMTEKLNGLEGRNGGYILLLDINDFKCVNDTFGHTVGDTVLKLIGRSLSSMEIFQSLTARIGSDEFVMILNNTTDPEKMKETAEKVLKLFEESFWVENTQLFLTISMGIAAFPSDGNTVEELLKNADLAMYRSKKMGKHGYVFYDHSMGEELRNKSHMQNRMRQALYKGEYLLHYQAQLDALTGKVHGFEALVRWDSPYYGMVYPHRFIPLAEESGLIVLLGDWIFNSACRFALKLYQAGLTDIYVTINISMLQLAQKDFCDRIMGHVRSVGVPSRMIGIEITESIVMDSFESNTAKLRQLREQGIRIFLDDFGTGYSSLNYLTQLPIDVVKIDKSFIRSISKNMEGSVVIDSIINLAHKLGLEVIAEGVEKEEQLVLLKERHCNLVQGFLFNRPAPEDELEILKKGG